ncbi:hypothetical protein HDV01_000369 [Terramyces sp. JEL0728]|nr:hypothetical protein HDV01_000369 [Terramyces sp. JEL0728]
MDQLSMMLQTPWHNPKAKPKEKKEKKRKLIQSSESPESLSTNSSPEFGFQFDPSFFQQPVDFDQFMTNPLDFHLPNQMGPVGQIGGVEFDNFFNELDLERHLVENSFLFSTSANLKKALCFHSTFFSTHPLLFPSKKPTLAEKYQKAQAYVIKETPKVYTNNQELCDDVRALLIQAMSLFSLGNCEESRKLTSQAYFTGKTHGLFTAETFQGGNSIISVDDLNSQVALMSITQKSFYSNASEVEITEGLAIIAFCLRADTLNSIASGQGFLIDEAEYPSMHKPAFARPATTSSRHQNVPHNLAQNSIWENTQWAPMYDDIKQLSVSIGDWLPDAKMRAYSEIFLWKIVRKALRFTRTYKYSQICSKKDKAFYKRRKFNYIIVRQFCDTPENFAPFTDLTVFDSSNYMNPKPFPKIRNSPDIINLYLTLLVMTCYLHLSGDQNDCSNLYSLKIDQPSAYTSKQILFCCMMALDHILRMCNTPNVPRDSFFGAYDYNTIQLTQAMMTPDDHHPSPIFTDAYSALLIYSISSSCFMAHTKDPLCQVIKDTIQSSVLPTLKRIGNIWPMATKYHDFLEAQIN